MVDVVDTCCLGHTGGKGLKEKKVRKTFENSVSVRGIHDQSLLETLTKGYEKGYATTRVICYLDKLFWEREGVSLNLQMVMVRVVVTFHRIIEL